MSAKIKVTDRLIIELAYSVILHNHNTVKFDIFVDSFSWLYTKFLEKFFMAKILKINWFPVI